MKLILASERDPAAVNIAEHLLEFGDFEKMDPGIYSAENATLVLISGESTELHQPPVEAEEIIVVSRHASESGRPSLTAHTPGQPEQLRLAVASPRTLRSVLRGLQRAKEELGLNYQVSLEATHHGPASLEIPVTFVEVGSAPEHWRDASAAEAAARAVLAALSPSECRGSVGVGGIHYAPILTRVSLETDVGVGHILPKYVQLSERLLRLAIERTAGGVDLVVVDWKGATVEQREICRRVAAKFGIPVVKAGNLIRKDLNQTPDNSKTQVTGFAGG